MKKGIRIIRKQLYFQHIISREHPVKNYMGSLARYTRRIKITPISIILKKRVIVLLQVRIWKLKDRKSTRLNSSHVAKSYPVFCLKKKTARKRLSTPSHSATHRT